MSENKEKYYKLELWGTFKRITAYQVSDDFYSYWKYKNELLKDYIYAIKNDKDYGGNPYYQEIAELKIESFKDKFSNKNYLYNYPNTGFEPDGVILKVYQTTDEFYFRKIQDFFTKSDFQSLKDKVILNSDNYWRILSEYSLNELKEKKIIYSDDYQISWDVPANKAFLILIFTVENSCSLGILKTKEEFDITKLRIPKTTVNKTLDHKRYYDPITKFLNFEQYFGEDLRFKPILFGDPSIKGDNDTWVMRSPIDCFNCGDFMEAGERKQAEEWCDGCGESVCSQCRYDNKHKKFTISCQICGKSYCPPCSKDYLSKEAEKYFDGTICEDCFLKLKRTGN